MKTRTTIVALALLVTVATASPAPAEEDARGLGRAGEAGRPFVNAFLSYPQAFPYQRLEAAKPCSAWFPIDRWQPHCCSFPTEETSLGKEQT